MARAIKQSVDGSGYPSSALFPITGETGEAEEGKGGGHQEDAIYATDADTDERAERSGRFTFLAPSSRRRYMNALQPEKEKGEDRQDGITIHREPL